MPIPAEVVRRGVIAFTRGPERRTFIAPDAELLGDLADWLDKAPDFRSRIAVTTPSALRGAMMAAAAPHAVEDAVARLARARPEFSASKVATAGQVAVGLIAVVVVAAALALTALPLLVAIFGILLLPVFLGVTALRLFAAADVSRRRRSAMRAIAVPLADHDLPIYSVLVAIRDEAALVPHLVANLGRLDWPADRLDIKIVVEADDATTIAAVRRVIAGPPFELVIVPVHAPRTKPKALAFALPYARGRFVTIYDAEDRPHPGQLREAHAAFAAAGPDLGCLQAPLVIENDHAGWLARMFTVEYAALFDGLLPALERLGLPLPLGGTSNHFRREALEEVGGWDPYNVTEDADLGMRLARHGYRTGTLTLPTGEDAPTNRGDWMRQRTRWFKGWVQTALVHTRQPRRLVRELGA